MLVRIWEHFRRFFVCYIIFFKNQTSLSLYLLKDHFHVTHKFSDKLFHYSLDPLIVNVANPGIKFTTVLFAKQTDCLLVGDSDGQVAVYELRNMPTALDNGRVRLGCKLFRSFCNSAVL